MRTTIFALAVSGILVWLGEAQEYRIPGATNAIAAESATPAIPIADQPAYLAKLTQRVIEYNTQSELLNQLAQEHRKRAKETPRDQSARSQWENELAKELVERASAIEVLLTNATKERLAFEQAHPDLGAPVTLDSAASAPRGPNPDEIAFLAKLAERRAAVLQEISAAGEAANLYATQLATNTANSGFVSGAYDPVSVSYLLHDSGNYLRQLQRELSDLDLKTLEFRALSRH